MQTRSHRSVASRILEGTCLLAVAVLIAGGQAPADTLHVDAGAPSGGDGSSWSAALVELDEALDQAFLDPSIDEIWVAAGTYRPSHGAMVLRTDSFRLVDGVALYGGFPALSFLTAPTMVARDPAVHSTVLSGDIDLDGTLSGNSNTVVYVNGVEGAVVDGFVITGGNADGTSSAYDAGLGGGMYVLNSSLEVRGCQLRENQALQGGGLFAGLSNVRILDSSFHANEASTAYGGAIQCWGDTSGEAPEPGLLCIARCSFSENLAGSLGGAIASSSCEVAVHSSLFVGNHALQRGGAISLVEGSLQVAHGTFVGNEAALQGGAIDANTSLSCVLANSILRGNEAPYGPQVSDIGGSAEVRSCCLEDLASSGLAAVDSFDLDPLFVDPLGADGVAGTADDDLSLRGDSPCINTGDASFLDLEPCFVDQQLDVAGKARGARVDLGAYEAERLGLVFALGDGSSGACPCGNESAAGTLEGCVNSTGLGGRLVARGTTRVAEDDLEFTATQLPAGKPALLFAGTVAISGVPFGDGLRGVAGAVTRLEVVAAGSLGRATFGPGLGFEAAWSAGDRRMFQAWYRDPEGPCGGGFNLTHGLELLLQP